MRTPILTALLMAAWVAAPPLSATPQTDIPGVVFIDVNADRLRDAGERGLARGMVSNQEVVVASDRRRPPLLVHEQARGCRSPQASRNTRCRMA